MNTTMSGKPKLITTTRSKTSVPPRKQTSTFTRADWLVPAELILLAALPALGGVISPVGIAVGAEIALDDTPFHALLLPITVGKPHIGSLCQRI